MIAIGGAIGTDGNHIEVAGLQPPLQLALRLFSHSRVTFRVSVDNLSIVSVFAQNVKERRPTTRARA